MDVNLLRAIRLSKQRILPAIAKQAAKSPGKEFFIRYLRIFFPLMGIPVRLSRSYQCYLEGSIDKNSKTGAVYYELVACNVEDNTIWYPSREKNTSINRVWRLAYYLPGVLCVLLRRGSQFRKLDLPALEVCIGYMGYKAFFESHNSIIPILISDISPTIHMQWSGALAAGNKVMWWQDDYHHYKGFSQENYFPYLCHYAAVLNEYGLKTVQDRSPDTRIYGRPGIKVQPLKKRVKTPLIGFASNVLFSANEEQIQHLSKVREQLKIDKFLCRLHPNARLDKSAMLPEWLQIAPKEQSLEEYAENINLALVGNSAVQLKLLCMGVLVIHIPGFDTFGFDGYKYVQGGFVYGSSELSALSLEEIYAFYQRPEFEEKLKAYVGVNANLRGLEALQHKI